MDSSNNFYIEYLVSCCFKEPEPADPWDDVFMATSLAPQCMQAIQGWLWLTHPGWNNYDEDCLNLNVFTPEVAH